MRRSGSAIGVAATAALLVAFFFSCASVRTGNSSRGASSRTSSKSSPTGDSGPSPAEESRNASGTPPKAPTAAAPLFSPASSLEGSVHVKLGIPTDADPSDDYLLNEKEYVLSYNPKKRVPNWVSWNLDRAHLGHVPRRNDFRSDPLLPPPLYRVTPQDYTNSGYDRGHMCPSADRTKTVSGNQSTFLMTNMQPQLHELNAGPWEKLEEFEREMAKRPNAELYILAGGIFSPSFVTVGHNVAVPKSNYKIVVELSRGEGPKDVTPQTPVVAVIMPNRLGVGQHEWTDFLVSVDEIERKTGYEFLSKLPDAVQRTIEAKVGAPPAP